MLAPRWASFLSRAEGVPPCRNALEAPTSESTKPSEYSGDLSWIPLTRQLDGSGGRKKKENGMQIKQYARTEEPHIKYGIVLVEARIDIVDRVERKTSYESVDSRAS